MHLILSHLIHSDIWINAAVWNNSHSIIPQPYLLTSTLALNRSLYSQWSMDSHQRNTHLICFTDQESHVSWICNILKCFYAPISLFTHISLILDIKNVTDKHTYTHTSGLQEFNNKHLAGFDELETKSVSLPTYSNRVHPQSRPHGGYTAHNAHDYHTTEREKAPHAIKPRAPELSYFSFSLLLICFQCPHRLRLKH